MWLRTKVLCKRFKCSPCQEKHLEPPIIRRVLRANVLEVLCRRLETHRGPQSKGGPGGLLRTGSVSKAWHTALHIWPVPQSELPFPLGPALCIFKQAILSHHECFGGNHGETLIPFHKIMSGRGRGQRGGACRPFCKSFKYLWH